MICRLEIRRSGAMRDRGDAKAKGEMGRLEMRLAAVASTGNGATAIE